ncbi:MAG: hypothetical protein WCA30_18000 [Dermatophilaceae bacterium]
MTLTTHHIGRHNTARGSITHAPMHPLRTLTVVLLGAVAALYAVVFAVQLPHLSEPDNPAPIYAVLALGYLALAVTAARVDTLRLIWVLVGIQVLVVALFGWSVGMLYREGDEAFILDMQWLAGAVTLIQVVLIGVLVYRGMRARAVS